MIRGNSGCYLEILNDREIVKISKDVSYSNRLLSQCKKQQEFNSFNKIDHIRSPLIFNQKQEKGIFSFTMEYCNISDFISFFAISDKNYLIYFIDKIIRLIDQYEKICEYKKIDFSVINNKFNSSLDSLTSENDKFFLKAIFDKLIVEEIFIPIGICHGDLTLSNILFSNERDIILIDFLDSFLETPLQDMVKLRQDTCFSWSTQLANQEYDQLKIKIILKYIDDKLQENFKNKEYYINYYKLFQFINLVRALPYCQTNSVLYNFLINQIKNFLYE
jgi:hypothetical protein